MIRSAVVLILLIRCSVAFAGGLIVQPDHRQQLDNFKKKADEFRAKNLNRFGLEQLRAYDRSLDLFFEKEKADTLQSIEREDAKQNALLNNNYQALVKKKAALVVENESMDQGYTSLLTRTGLVILVLTLTASGILFAWNMRSRKKEEELMDFKTRKESAYVHSILGEQIMERARNGQRVFQEFKGCLDEINGRIEQLQQIKVNENGLGLWKESLAHTKKINQLLQQESIKNDALVQFAQSDSDEKVSADINQLCMQYFELVRDGFQSEPDRPEVKASTDLEKNLPRINVVPAAIGHLLIHVLTNAMQSVITKASRSIKGYEPKVALSTRILPRFLQIRIHDNGDGMDDKVMDKISQAFYTLKPDHDSGLGLYISERIMKNHKGEIRIESDKNRGTDIYLRFFIN